MKTLLHPRTAGRLEALLLKPSGSTIFHGSAGLGKATAARDLANQLNCLGDTPTLCANCRQIEAGNFPDLLHVTRGDKASLTIDQIRGLLSELALRPYRSGGTRVVIIDEAHLLTLEAQNALLKLLEEPPPRTLIILVTEQLEALLTTVRSRCGVIHFARPQTTALVALLTSRAGVTPTAATELAAASAGAPGTALTLASHPAEREALLALTSAATEAQGKTAFERLLLAARLVAAHADLAHFGDALHHHAVDRLAAGQLASEQALARLDALERFRLHTRAKVSPRVALERLMLELG